MSDTYSTDGPICPYCDHHHRADDPAFYDERAETFDCDNCQKPFKMYVYTSTSWTCGPLDEVSP